MGDHLRVLWLAQNRPDDISVGRKLLTHHLCEMGYDVSLTSTTPRAVLSEIRSAGTYDVVIGTTRAGAIAALLFKYLFGRPIVVDQIDPFSQFAWKVPDWIARIVLFAENCSIRSADSVLYVYESELPRVRKNAKTYFHTDFGVEYKQFASPDPKVIAKCNEQIERLETKENILLYVGGLEPPYHLKELIETMNFLSDWTLIILGAGSLEQTATEAAETMDNVQFLGTVPHEMIVGYCHLVDVGISLVDDARTLKVLEYMAAGLPVVQLDGESRERFGELLTYCSADPKDISLAVRRAPGEANPEQMQSYAAENSWRSIAEDYAQAIEIATTE